MTMNKSFAEMQWRERYEDLQLEQERKRKMDQSTVEKVAAKVHEAWIDLKKSQGVTTRLADDGEEQMVPYEQLSERAKQADRNTAAATLSALEALGYSIVPPKG